MIQEKIRRAKYVQHNENLENLLKALPLPVVYTSTQIRSFEPQAKHIRPLPLGFSFRDVSEIKMDIDEVGSRPIRVYKSIDEYFRDNLA